MNELKKRYGVSDSFFNRYFMRNAESKFIVDMRMFMLWRKGRFLNPRDKRRHIQEFLAYELESFYQREQLIVPSIAFEITTRCSLRCRDCIALSPLIEAQVSKREFQHIDLAADSFKRDLDALTESIDGIRRLFLQGGEPLLNKELPEIIEYSAGNDKIQSVEIITNGSIMPTERLLDILEKYKSKIYFAINNYTHIPELRQRLRYDEAIAQLNERGIKHPLYSDLHWYRQPPLKKQGYAPEQLRQRFKECIFNYCAQILDGIFAVCPRASIGSQLGVLKIPPGECVNIRNRDRHSLRQELIAFYQKESYMACDFCSDWTEIVEPAIQDVIR